jgi:(2Fe-2S) ferredoxin
MIRNKEDCRLPVLNATFLSATTPPRRCAAALLHHRWKERIARAAAATERSRAGRQGAINKSGCLDQCEHGPTVVVYPEAVWYGNVQPEDAAEIVTEHLVGGRPVERLRLAEECVNTKSCPHRS